MIPLARTGRSELSWENAVMKGLEVIRFFLADDERFRVPMTLRRGVGRSVVGGTGNGQCPPEY